MNYIKLLHIEGFKKFVSLDVPFNEHMNILVGENEAGKSTILDALKTVLNQQYRTADKSVLRDLFNAQMVAEFRANPSVNTLPKIYIEVELVLDPQEKMLHTFTERCMGGGSSRPRSTAFALNVSMTKNSALVWSNQS